MPADDVSPARGVYKPIQSTFCVSVRHVQPGGVYAGTDLRYKLPQMFDAVEVYVVYFVADLLGFDLLELSSYTVIHRGDLLQTICVLNVTMAVTLGPQEDLGPDDRPRAVAPVPLGEPSAYFLLDSCLGYAVHFFPLAQKEPSGWTCTGIAVTFFPSTRKIPKPCTQLAAPALM